MTIKDLIAEADENLYKSKRARTNFEKITLESEKNRLLKRNARL